MSNRDKVVKLAAKELQFGARDGTYLGERIADALTDAGLLAPDTDHPATLTTVADFAAAPTGTVVTHPGGAAVKAREDWWLITGIGQSRLDNSVGDEDEPRTVLRWGKGEGE